MFSFLNILKKNQSPPSDLSTQLKEYNDSRYTKNLSALCHAPSVNMYFAQDGNVKLCCHNMEYSIGKYPEQSLTEIWNSDAAKKIRQDMKEYKLYEGCTVCKRDLDMGAYDEVSARHFDSLPIHKSYPTMMEFLLTNTCNLECIMCKGEFSSLIRQNREKLPPIPNVYNDAFLEQIREFIPYLHEARFSGSGEAFLIDANYKIWEMILELNPKCLIMIQTNGMVLNSRIKDLLSRGNFQIGVSLDSLEKEVFETIRPHARLERVLENIHYFSDYCNSKKIKFSIALCVMRQNWRELPAFIKFANFINATATFHKVYYPMEYSLKTLARIELEEIVNYLKLFSFEEQNQLQKKNAKHFQYIVELLEKWKNEAIFIKAENLTEQEMEVSIIDKALVFFEQENLPEDIVQNEIVLFKNKFQKLLEIFSLKGKKKEILLPIYGTDFSQLYPIFKNQSVEELSKLAEQNLPNIG